MNILFICKYNRFRSKVAEKYFKRVNKNPNIKIRTAGVIKVKRSLDSSEKKRNIYLKKKFGFALNAKTKSVSIGLLTWADKIIIVADDVPKKLFNSSKWKDKVVVWKIPDENADDKKNINKIVGSIINKIDSLIIKLSRRALSFASFKPPEVK